jgi:hypothetical protein
MVLVDEVVDFDGNGLSLVAVVAAADSGVLWQSLALKRG